MDGIPLCMDYYKWPVNSNEDRIETLLIGDELGICHMYNFTQNDWHICEYRLGTKSGPNKCCEEEIKKAFEEKFEPSK